MTEERLLKIPKIELHCHLDGSLSQEFIQRSLKREVDQEELSVSSNCKSLEEYLKKFDLPGACLRNEEGLEGAGYDILKTMSKEQVCYAEIRFAPLFSVTQNMGTKQVIEALLRGLEKGKKEFDIDYNVITCAMRHHSSYDNLEMLKVAREFLGQGICAADLAGAEAQYPMTDFVELFTNTKRLGMPFTIHAGECGNIKNILDAVEIGARRIGHGIAMRGNKEVQKRLQQAGVGVEMCPFSNLQTKAVPRIEEYPIQEFLSTGLQVTVNTDNRTVSNTSLVKELALVQNACAVTDEQVIQLMKNAADIAFANDEVKQKMYQRLAEFK